MTELQSGDLDLSDRRVMKSRQSPSRPVVFAIVSSAIFMSAIDLTIVATALSAIKHSLHASINWAGWTITIYGLFVVVSLPICGNLSGRYGRRRVFLLGVGVFTLSSLLCGLSSDIYLLIPLRGLQALGGGAILPASAGLIADHFGSGRDRAIALFGTISSTGQLVGPLIGSALVTYLSWRWIFFVNVPIGAVLVLCTLRLIPPSPPGASSRIDLSGVFLMSSGVLCLLFGVTMLGDARTSVTSPLFLVPVIAGLVLIVLFVGNSGRAMNPFIPLRFLRGRGFAVMNAINLMHGMVTFGVASLIPLYAENRYHLSTLRAGTLLTFRAVGMIVAGAMATMALRRTGYRRPMFVGLVILAGGTALMGIGPRFGLSPFVWLATSVGIVGLGLAAVYPASSNACLNLAPDHVSTITGIRMMFVNLGVIVSVSITTAILNRSSNPGMVHAHILWVAAAMIAVIEIPLVFRVPEHRGEW